MDDDVGDDAGEAPVPPEDDQFDEDNLLEEETSHQENKGYRDDATMSDIVEDNAEDRFDAGGNPDATEKDLEDAAHAP